MKKIAIFGLSLFLIIGVFSCEKEEIQPVVDNSTNEVLSKIRIEKINKEEINRIIDEMEQTNGRNSYMEWQVNPTCSNGNVVFVVRDAPNDAAIKLFYSIAGYPIYINLNRHTGNNRYQYASVSIPSNLKGNWGYRYVDKYTQVGFPLAQGYSFEYTGVNLVSNGKSSLYWIFGHDNSTWSNRNGWRIVLGSAFHTGIDLYAQDWNWGSWNDDLGKTVHSALDGKVVYAGNKNCYGNTVDIVQKFGNKWFMFRVTHLDVINVSLNNIVSSGQKIGEVGNTGSGQCGSSFPAHAHCVLYEVSKSGNSYNIIKGLDYDLNAICN